MGNKRFEIISAAGAIKEYKKLNNFIIVKEKREKDMNKIGR